MECGDIFLLLFLGGWNLRPCACQASTPLSYTPSRRENFITITIIIITIITLVVVLGAGDATEGLICARHVLQH